MSDTNSKTASTLMAHGKQLSCTSWSLPATPSHELQVCEYDELICVALVDYETGNTILHLHVER